MAFLANKAGSISSLGEWKLRLAPCWFPHGRSVVEIEAIKKALSLFFRPVLIEEGHFCSLASLPLEKAP